MGLGLEGARRGVTLSYLGDLFLSFSCLSFRVCEVSVCIIVPGLKWDDLVVLLLRIP